MDQNSPDQPTPILLNEQAPPPPAQVTATPLSTPTEAPRPRSSKKLLWLLLIPLAFLSFWAALGPTNRANINPPANLATAFANTPQPQVVTVNVGPTDGSDAMWADSQKSGLTILGGAKHWLGEGSIDVPNNIPQRLWVDGKLVLTTYGYISDAISENGLHYGYTVGSDLDNNISSLWIDGQQVNGGKDIKLLSISNDGGSYLYTCGSCGGHVQGLWEGDRFIAAISSPNPNGDIGNLLNVSADGSHYCYTFDAPGPAIIDGKPVSFPDGLDACSPNSKNTSTSTSHPIFPEGSYNDVFVNGKKIDSGNIEHQFVDDNGKATYIKSNGGGGGTIILHGKVYNFGSQLPEELNFSPNQTNLLFYDNGWYLNAKRLDGVQLKGAPIQVESGPDDSDWQLTDSILYVYKVN